MQKSNELFKKSLQFVPGGVHSPVRSFKGFEQSPIFFEKAEGPFLWSVDGDKYIDYCQSFGPLILGHRDADVQDVVLAQVHKAWTFGACEPYSLKLAEWLIQELPFIEKLRFVSSGTEAVMSALRVARAATGRNLVLKFDGCYHGHSDPLLVKSGSGLAGESSSSSLGVSEEVAKQTLVVSLNSEEEVTKVFEQQGSQIAAIIIEPLPANYGLLIQRIEFLKHLREISKKYGALLIFDEVISGFRVDLQGMAGLTGIDPDLVTYGKILGGGFPVGCYAGKKKYMDLVAPLGGVYQAGTLSANPIGMVAGLATLEKMKRINGWKILNDKTNHFQKELSEVLSPYGLQISTMSSLFWIHAKVASPIRTIADIPQGQSAQFKKLFLSLLKQGVYLAPHAYEVGFLSLAHTDQVLNQTIKSIADCLKQN